MSIEHVLGRAESLGVDPRALVVGREVNCVPQAPSHRWIVVPTSGAGVVIGGMDRGTFAPYARFEDDSEAAAALARLTTAPAAPLLDRPANQIRDAAGRLAARLVSLTGDDGVIPSKEVPVGTPFDHLGNESGHCLYLFGTPMQQRSLPPTDLNEHRLGYVLRGQLPDGAAVVRVPPWFGQPGGGVMVTLDRVIASYCDAGLLERFRLA